MHHLLFSSLTKWRFLGRKHYRRLSYTFNDPPIGTPTHIHLSFQALCGTPSTHTFTFDGYIGHLPITILIDTGSSHNIVQPLLAPHLQLCTIPITPFSVMIGNGNKI